MSQDRPCKRCIKRNIGHLCHDEPREGPRKSKGEHDSVGPEDEKSPKDEYSVTPTLPGASMMEDSGQSLMQDTGIGSAPEISDQMPVANLGFTAQPSPLNGNASTRKLD